MHENYVSKATIVAWMLWTKALLLVVAVWVLAVFHVSDDIARAVSVTGIMAMAIAIAWQVRLYVTRLCELIRATAGLDGPPRGADLRPVNGSQRAR